MTTNKKSLPKGWEEKKIGKVLYEKNNLPNSYNYIILDDVIKKESSNISHNKIKKNKGKFPVYGAKGFVQNISFYQQEKEYLSIIKDGAGIGRISLHPGKSSVLATMQYLVPKKNVDINFIKYFLLTIDFEKYRKGSTIPHIYFKDYKSEKFPLLDLSEQKRIVALLDRTFEAIDKGKNIAEQNLKNAKELFESYLNNIFEKKGDDWVSCELNDYVNFIDYRGRTPIKTDSGVRLITAKNIKLGYLQLKPEEFIAEDNYESWMTRGIPNYGDIIFTTEAPLAHIAQIKTTEKLAFAQRVIVMQPAPDKINQTFLKYLLISNPIRNKILNKGTGATVLGIKSSLLKKIDIDFPKLLTKQKQIVKKLDKLSVETKRLEEIYMQKLANMEELKKSILQKAFCGGL